MPKNLAELARAALTAKHTLGAAAPRALPTRRDSTSTGAVVDTCIRDGLGFVLLSHRRKDACFAEELYFSTQLDDASWTASEHLSGGAVGIDPTNARDITEILSGRSLVVFGESETDLFTGRPQADDGYELLRFIELLVDKEVSHLEIESASPDADAGRSLIHKPLISQVALLALFPGERFTIRAMGGKGLLPAPLASRTS
ncbi:hypothetical protein GCM10010372_05630 [Streptomyces tauricus]|uniref:hypothetical protein n=1 Tax=Streptomyces tauricus TaxID=68274 RepID=UPI0016760CBE|nr:hypothetical protein [Streptomyces tauricus]GHA09067.1 hypothetical protein GCM10010372_05630 [Streptomyces tauricus]